MLSDHQAPPTGFGGILEKLNMGCFVIWCKGGLKQDSISFLFIWIHHVSNNQKHYTTYFLNNIPSLSVDVSSPDLFGSIHEESSLSSVSLASISKSWCENISQRYRNVALFYCYAIVNVVYFVFLFYREQFCIL